MLVLKLQHFWRFDPAVAFTFDEEFVFNLAPPFKTRKSRRLLAYFNMLSIDNYWQDIT